MHDLHDRDLLNQNLHLNQIPRFVYTEKCEKPILCDGWECWLLFYCHCLKMCGEGWDSRVSGWLAFFGAPESVSSWTSAL